MERQTIELLKPSAGHWIVSTEEDGMRFFYRAVINGNAEDYTECTDEEKKAYEEEARRKTEEAMAHEELERKRREVEDVEVVE